MSLSDHVVVFDRGRPICEGPPSVVQSDPRGPGGLPWHLTPTEYLLELSDIEAGYGRAALVLRGLTVKVPPATVVCLVGPNGAGKSTVLKVASGMLTPRSGTILVDGQDVTGQRPQQMLTPGSGARPPGTQRLPGDDRRGERPAGRLLRQGQAVVADRVDFVKALFPVVGERWSALAGALSGGQQKQVEFARSLMVSPKVVLLDEPSMGLDPRTTGTVFEQVVRMRDAGTAVLLVEQNARRALETADIGCVLDLGRVHITGPAAELLADPQLGRALPRRPPCRAPPLHDLTRRRPHVRHDLPHHHERRHRPHGLPPAPAAVHPGHPRRRRPRAAGRHPAPGRAGARRPQRRQARPDRRRSTASPTGRPTSTRRSPTTRARSTSTPRSPASARRRSSRRSRPASTSTPRSRSPSRWPRASSWSTRPQRPASSTASSTTSCTCPA